jgi:hypothetical protein
MAKFKGRKKDPHPPDKPVMFTVHIKSLGEAWTVDCSGIDEVLSDDGLPGEFVQGHIEECVIYKNGVRVTRNIRTWDELVEHIVKNSTTLMRSLLKE